MDIPARARSTPAQPDMLAQSGFAAFWAIYPRRDGKAPAEKAYAKALQRGANPADIEAGARLLAGKVERERTEPRYIPMPATWLNGSRWADESLRVSPMAQKQDARVRKSILDLGGEVAAEMAGHDGSQHPIGDLEVDYE